MSRGKAQYGYRYKWTPASRPANPATSFEAEAAITTDGTRETHAQILLAIVKSSPGLTTGEIGEQSDLGQMATRKRLSDLKNQGLVYQGQPRIWEATGRRHSTWWPVGEELGW